MARVHVINSVQTASSKWNGAQLALQWCRYLYDDGTMEHGYRFIWLTKEGRLLPQRGQARLPSLKVATDLMARAKEQGWGGHKDEDFDE